MAKQFDSHLYLFLPLITCDNISMWQSNVTHTYSYSYLLPCDNVFYKQQFLKKCKYAHRLWTCTKRIAIHQVYMFLSGSMLALLIILLTRFLKWWTSNPPTKPELIFSAKIHIGSILADKMVVLANISSIKIPSRLQILC